VETKDRAKRVFIVGCRRSGTTWTMMLFAHHPNVVTLRFADFFRPLKRFGGWWGRSDGHGLRAVLRDPVERFAGAAGKDGLAEIELRDIVSKQRYYELVRPVADDVYDRVAACKEGTLAVVEQTPENVRCWEDVLAVFPDAYFLHIIRDPRAVFCSHRNASRSWADPLRFSSSPIEVAREWGREVHHGRRIADATERYREVRFEDLKQDPEASLKEVFEWLDLPADEAIVRGALEATAIDKVRGSSLGPKGFFRKGKASGWREEMSRTEVRTVEYYLGSYMDRLGYSTVNQLPIGPPLRVRLAGLREGLGRYLRESLTGRKSPIRRMLARTLKPFPRLYRVAASTKKNLKN
jgi:hypothetical protein